MNAKDIYPENHYIYKANDKETVSGYFSIYQAKNGMIGIVMSDRNTLLTHKQCKDLAIDIFILDEFNFEDFKKAYNL